MKIALSVVAFILSSSALANSQSLRLSGYVPLTAELQVKYDKNGKLVVYQPGYNKLKLKNVKKRQLASIKEEPVSTIILEAP